MSETLDEVRLVYLHREAAKWWNSRREEGDTAVFCGWFWLHGNVEAGPFRTRSAALRDAYYRYVLHDDVPMAAHAPEQMVAQRKRRAARSTKAVGREVATHAHL